MKGVFAAMETEQKSERQKEAGKQRASQGRQWWPTRPFGFAYAVGIPVLNDDGNQKVNDKGHRVWEVPPRPVLDANKIPTLDATEAGLIREAYRSILAGGSLRGIANEWNSKKLATPKGNTWTGTQVGQLLANPRNAGLRTYGYRANKRIGVGEDLELFEAAWPAIVTRDVWEGVSAILADPERRNGTSRARKHLLSNIATCSECQKGMGSGVTNAGTKIYRCNQPGCSKVSRDKERVDAMVTEAVVWRLSREDAADLVVDRSREDLADLQAQADALRASIKKAEAEYADDVIDGRMLKARKEKANQKLAVVKAQLQDANRAEIFEGLSLGTDLVDAEFDGLTLDRKRTVIRALLTVTVLPTSTRGRTFNREDVDVVFRQPLG
jgi:hypothetical protein